VALAVALARKRGWLAPSAAVASAAIVILTLSRGAMTLFVVGSGLTYLFSAAKSLTPRKLLVAFVGVLAVGALLIKAGHTITERFEGAPEQSAESRRGYEKAAGLILEDYPIGIGLNQFSLVLSAGGYADRTNLAHDDRSAIVHNIYWLTAAETGYLGLAAFVGLLLTTLWLAFWHGLRARGDVRGDVLLGLGAGLVALYLQGFLEWGLRTTQLSYLFWGAAAIVATTARQLRAGLGSDGRT
jgi:O-antigen ligase